jgi:hypothetical protein
MAGTIHAPEIVKIAPTTMPSNEGYGRLTAIRTPKEWLTSLPPDLVAKDAAMPFRLHPRKAGGVATTATYRTAEKRDRTSEKYEASRTTYRRKL